MSIRIRRLLSIRAWAFGLVLQVSAIVPRGAAAPPSTASEPIRAQVVSPVTFVVRGQGERFLIQLNDAARIAEARKILSGQARQRIVFGELADGDGGFNRDIGSGRVWTWHLVPESIIFTDVTAEIFDGRPSDVEQNKTYWLTTVKRYGPWSPTLEAEGTSTAGEFSAISTRGFVGTGDNRMILGVIVRDRSKKILIRALGPGLGTLGITGFLESPTIELYNGSGQRLAENTRWGTQGAEQVAAIQNAIDLLRLMKLPTTSADSLLLLRLEPGAYTVVISGAGGTTGVVLGDLYEAP